ncbi:MAG TPA: hypothetical protein ENL44_02795, partial [Thermoplasmatales archaeon]|nr:hypothetical protein [Thermoplasmatales archaeon]
MVGNGMGMSQSLIENAIAHMKDEKRKLANRDNLFGEPQIIIVGCGGAGGNTITRLHKLGVKGAKTIALNTDKQ